MTGRSNSFLLVSGINDKDSCITNKNVPILGNSLIGIFKQTDFLRNVTTLLQINDVHSFMRDHHFFHIDVAATKVRDAHITITKFELSNHDGQN